MKNLSFIALLLISLAFFSNCGPAKKNIMPVADNKPETYTVQMLKKLITGRINIIKSPVKCRFEQNNTTNNLYGELLFENNAASIKLYSALNYAKIESYCSTDTMYSIINGKYETADLKLYDKNRIMGLIHLILTGKTESPDITITEQTADRVIFTVFSGKINIVLDKHTDTIAEIYYQDIKIKYDKYRIINGNQIPIKIRIESSTPSNSFNAELSFSKNKLWVE